MRRWIALISVALLAVGVAVATQPVSSAVAGSTPPAPSSSRLSGTDRYAVAVAVSQAGFPGTAPIVFLATGANYPDALGAGPAGAKLGGPLLLTPGDALPSSVAAEIQRLHPATVDIVGGTGSVSTAVEDAIRAMSFHPTVNRFGGVDRYAAARSLISSVWSAAPTMFIATGANFPDALSAAAAAGSVGAPVLLVDGSASGLDAATWALLTGESTTTVHIAGGTGSVSIGIENALIAHLGAAHVTRAAGADRYVASETVAEQFFGASATAYIATGANFPDALAASALAGAHHAPLLTVPGTCVPSDTIDELERLGVASIVIVGGPASVTPAAAILSPCTPPTPSVRWLSQSLQNSKHTDFWLGLSCPDSGFCVAVGDPGVIDRRVGSTWTAEASPLPLGASGVVNEPDAVSCSTVFYCLIVGSYSNSGFLFSELVPFTNGDYGTATTPNGPPDTTGLNQSMNLAAVSCWADKHCVAVGNYQDTSNRQSPYSVSVTGSIQADVKIPVPASAATNPQALEAAIDCPAAGTCYALGSFLDSSAHRRPMISTLASGAWTTASIALPADAATDPAFLPQKLDCFSTAVCVGIGFYSADAGDAGTAMIGLTSGAWSAIEPLNSGGATAVSAVDVSCAFSSGCLVAQNATIGGAKRVETQAFDAHGWESHTVMPVPSGVTGAMTATAIGCFSSGCTIFGTTPIASHYQAFQQTFSMAGNTATLLGSGGQTIVNNVSMASCSWAGDCVGLGDNVNVF